MTPPDALAAIGRIIYGAGWKQPLADLVGINRETPRRWLTGHTDLPPGHGVFDDILEALDQQRAEVAEVIAEMRNTPAG